MLIRKIRRLAALAAVAAIPALGLALPASAATPACTAVPGHACGSWNSEVPNLPDLDVAGAASNPGTSVIVFTRTTHDKAEDFSVRTVADDSTSTFPTVTDTFGGTVPVGANAVRVEYTPNGVASNLCLSSVNPNGFANVQLRPCDNSATTYNPFQTFQSAVATGDFTAVQFAEVIHHLVLTNPANNGSIGTVGHRVHVTFASNHHATGQVWGQNGA